MKLNTQSKFLLIAHHPEKGRFLISDLQINYGIIGAALLKMSLDEQIKIEEKKLILLKDVNTDDLIISDISSVISTSKKTRKIKYWITKLSRKSRKFKWEILAELERHNLLRIEDKKFLGLIPYRRSYLTDNNTRENIINQLKKDALFGGELDNDTISILSLIEACNMHKIIASDKTELKRLKKELKYIIKESPIAGAVEKTIEEVQAAIMVAMIASTAAASSSH